MAESPVKFIPSWSHSKLVDFETCKLRAQLKHGQRIPEPQRPLRPGQTEHANDRGTRVHQSCEDYVRGKADELAPEAEKHFGPQLDLLRVLFAEGLVSLEGEWGMGESWEVAEWRTAWLRLKLDALVHVDPTHAVVIDYKTGRKFGNEIKHAEQLQLYQLVTLLRYPQLEFVTAELWYLDQNEVTSRTFRRDQGLRFADKWHRRGLALTECKSFPASPSIHNCKWCEYGPWGTAHCQKGVR